jgi:hypothetical protein
MKLLETIKEATEAGLIVNFQGSSFNDNGFVVGVTYQDSPSEKTTYSTSIGKELDEDKIIDAIKLIRSKFPDKPVIKKPKVTVDSIAQDAPVKGSGKSSAKKRKR